MLPLIAALAAQAGPHDQAEQLIEILALHGDQRILCTRNVDRHIVMEMANRAFDGLKRLPDQGAGLAGPAASHRPGAGEMVIDLTAHHAGFAHNSFG